MRIVSWLLDSLILFFRPLLGFQGGQDRSSPCIFPLSCTEYARLLLEQKPLYKALFLIAIRLLQCNPIGAYFLFRKK